MDNGQWREFMDAAMGVPPGRVTVAAVRRQLVRRRVKEAAIGVVAVAVGAVLGVTAADRVFGAASGPATSRRPVSTVYVAFPDTLKAHGVFVPGMITPISTATNRPGTPIRLHFLGPLAATPNGKTLYIDAERGIVPLNTATNTLGKPIGVGRTEYGIAIDPNGKTAYVGGLANAIVPLNIATNTLGRPIHLPLGIFPGQMVFTPDGRTAYVITKDSVTPVDTATNKPGKPISVGKSPIVIRITPDGKTVYVGGLYTVTPISTANNTAGKPIHVGIAPSAMAITPDGKTVYIGGGETVIPINTGTETAGKPIHLGVPAEELVTTPDGKTVYVANGEGPVGRVIPISTATNKPGKPILIGINLNIAITPNGKTLYAVALGKPYAAEIGRVVPISTATNTPGKPILHVGHGPFPGLVITR